MKFIRLLLLVAACCVFAPTAPAQQTLKVDASGNPTTPLNLTGANVTGKNSLVPTAVKTAAYTAAVGDFVPVDASSASVTITLPTAPADGAVIGVKLIAVSGSYAVTVACGGTDKFNKGGGAASITLGLLNQGNLYQYKGGIWYTTAGDTPLSQLDARYATAAQGALAASAAQPTDSHFPQTRDITPASFSGLQFWFRGSDLANLADGASVATWPDRSGNGYNATQSTSANQPIKVTGYDGRVAVQFSASGKGLTLPSGLSINRQTQSVYLVVRHGIKIQDGVGGFPIDLGSGLQNGFWFNGSRPQIFNGGSSPQTTQYVVPAQTSFIAYGWRASSSATQFRIGSVRYSAGPISASSSTVTGGRLGGAANSTSYDFLGDIAEAVGYNRTLSVTEEDALVAYFARPPLRLNVVVDGNSLTYGYDSTNSYNAPISQSYPAQMNRLLGDGVKIINFAVVGQTSAQMQSDASTQIDPLIDNANYPGANLLLAWEITNSIAGGSTGTSAYNDFVTYCQARRAAGWKVLVATCLSRGTFSGTQEGYRQTANTNLRNSWPTFADGIVDLDAVAGIGGVGAYSNTTYFDTDTIHLTRVGYELVARAFASAVERFRNAGGFTLPTLTDGATVTQVCDPVFSTQSAVVTLGGNRTLAITGAAAGMRGSLLVKQDATGSRTLTLPSGSKVAGGGAGAITLSTAANAVDRLNWEAADGIFYFSVTTNFN